jgi:hypothetical protein
MARDETPPFARGETYYNGETIDGNNLGGVNLEGKEYVFEVNAPDDYAASDPSGRPVRVKVVRNRSGINLKPARIAHFNPADPYECSVDGYCYGVSQRPAGVIDEFLPPAGVPPLDLFYLVTEGPTKVTQLSANADVLAIGDRLVPGLGTSATNNDAGRVAKQAQATISDTTTTAAAFSNIQNCVGFAAQADNSNEDAQIRAIVHRAHK